MVYLWWLTAAMLSGTFKHLPGIPRTANLVLGNAQVAPALGRNLAACPAAGTCTATVTMPLSADAAAIMATEGFQSRGSSNLTVWQQ